MNNMINLDTIIRKLNGQTPHLANEEVLVTIDLTSKKAIEKTLMVRLAGNFQDYLVANNQNPTRSSSGKLSTYYVRDAQNERTLAIEISFDVFCPKGHEIKIAEALHGELSPARAFANLMERWVREFIPLGDEGRFIDTYDAAHKQLVTHLANRAATQVGLELKPKVALSGEAAVAREIVVGPIEIGVRLQDYKEEQKIIVEAGLEIDDQIYVKAFVFQERQATPEELFKCNLREYFSKQVTFQQFSRELQYPNFKQPLQQTLSAALQPVGRRVAFINFSTSQPGNVKPGPEFVSVAYNHVHYVHGRTQPIVIQNTVQLYCENSVAFLASGVTDLEAWVKSTLNVILKRHLIGKTYVDLLLRFDPLEQIIKRDLSAHAASLGYAVDHLVSLPDLKERDLTKPFLLETEDTFETKLDGFEVQIKFDIKLRIQNLQSIEKYLNPGRDVKEAIKALVFSEARQCLRNVHPEQFYLYFNHPKETDEVAVTAPPQDDERLAVKDLLCKRIIESLRSEFNAEIFDLTPRVGRSDLTERYKRLCNEIRDFCVRLEPPDPHGTETLTLTGNFELRGVYPDSAGWQRFSALRLDLDGLQKQLENHLKTELKTYSQPSFMFQNRFGRHQVFALVENYARQYMRREFGLIVHLTNLDRNTTEVEEGQRQAIIDLEKKRLDAEKRQGQLLVHRLEELRIGRANLLSVSPINKEELEQIDENIQLLQTELEATSARFGAHQLAPALETQRPDSLPRADEAMHVAVQYELESAPKGQLTD